MRNWIRSHAVAQALLLGVLAASFAMTPAVASAKGVSSETILGEASKTGGFTIERVDGASLGDLITTVAAWLIGVVVSVFVLKVVLTAVDRLILGGDIRSGRVEEGAVHHANQHMPKHGSNIDSSFLVGIPIIGAYPPPDSENKQFNYSDGSGHSIQKVFSNGYNGGMTWTQIFLNFGKQLAICVGAWFLVNLIVGLVGWFMGTVAV